MIIFKKLYVVCLICSSFSQGQRISQNKCQEYRDLTVQRSTVRHLLPIPQQVVIERFNCSKTVNLIHGGEVSKRGEFPHQALLGWRLENHPRRVDFRCGGSLISDWFVLTAGHCLKQGEPDFVRLGEYDLKHDDGFQIDYNIESVIPHPDYKFSRSYYDIALIKLQDSVTFSRFIRPACLWGGLDLNVTSVIATGFGFTEEGDHLSNKLRKVQLDFLEKGDCETQFLGLRNFNMGIQDGQLCIGSKREGKDTCQGDSGGPIQVVTEPEGCSYHVIGVTSTGSSCGVGQSPSIYTQVASYIDWIEGIVWA